MSTRNLSWTYGAWSDYQTWVENDKRILKRVNMLIRDILREPFSGIGDPEPLKHNFSGCWSRRIDSEHRLVYHVSDEAITVMQCRYHYRQK